MTVNGAQPKVELVGVIEKGQDEDAGPGRERKYGANELGTSRPLRVLKR